MRNLEMSELENIFGGNLCHIAGNHILIAIIVAGILALTYPVLEMLFGYAAES